MIKISRLRGVCGALFVLLCAGCGQPEETWYDRSKAADNRKEEYVEEQMRHGMSEVQAKDAWALRVSIEDTLGRKPAEVEGTELLNKVSE
ncbi:MAG: hypothetical protein M5U15_00950 [Kiritimatiellae bacterium]|nr:hypothetical protein [Kiritimatiellia bacterium]